ncbi:MAG: single-strand DNA-binding protein [Actinomycetota bacterium]|jgi:single-strand DNA-binding protein|nr:single-strand DNA-binding protein [Actinomycetota bacterium]
MLNVVVVRGRLSRDAEERHLPSSGDRIVGLEVTVRRDGAEKAESVPVVWRNAPAAAVALAAGDEVLVIGHVARRFFRAGGSTQSRTEVVARTVVPTRQGKRMESALAQAAAELEAGTLAPAGGRRRSS